MCRWQGLLCRQEERYAARASQKTLVVLHECCKLGRTTSRRLGLFCCFSQSVEQKGYVYFGHNYSKFKNVSCDSFRLYKVTDQTTTVKSPKAHFVLVFLAFDTHIKSTTNLLHSKSKLAIVINPCCKPLFVRYVCMIVDGLVKKKGLG